MHTITIRVQDGFIQAVHGVPPGLTVRVLDFDCDDHLDGMGIPCTRTDYHHQPSEHAPEGDARVEGAGGPAGSGGGFS